MSDIGVQPDAHVRTDSDAMAEYGKLTGRPAACLTIAGPGPSRARSGPCPRGPRRCSATPTRSTHDGPSMVEVITDPNLV
jgi:hypothetical protein